MILIVVSVMACLFYSLVCAAVVLAPLIFAVVAPVYQYTRAAGTWYLVYNRQPGTSLIKGAKQCETMHRL